MKEPDADTVQRARRLINHHPAALRSVNWSLEPADNALHHLEIETKHGQVVVFDHHIPVVYSQPPQPQIHPGPRHWRDLTLEAPVAFDGRPVVVSVDFELSPPCWRLRLSTGAELHFILGETAALLSIHHDDTQ
jgi:hypothetical protein